MSKIDTSAWKEFKIKDIFGEAKLGKYHNPESLYKDDNGYEYICASNQNNGVNKDMPKVNGENLSLTTGNIIAWGKQCPMFTYHKNPCVTSQGMYYLELDDSIDENAAMFIIACLTNRLEGKYGYSNCLIGSKLDEKTISLPVKETEEIDWEFMEDYIKAIQKIVIKDVVKYKDEVISKTKQVVAG